jgi:tetratricopeptide (TPR) repeat protein
VQGLDAVIAERVNSPAGPPVEGLDHRMFTQEVTIPPPPIEDVVAGSNEGRGSMEIDLTTVLGDLRMGDAPPPPPPSPQDLDRVFAGLRSDAAREEAADDAGEHMALARTYLEMGMKTEAVDPLETAARSPNFRFEAAGALGRLARERGDLVRAVDWFEQAAEVPPPSVEEGRALLYDLGATLESAGESARALAVFLELQADADSYRDVAVRVARLARSETGG